MRTLFSKNWRTTFSGLVAGIPVLLSGILENDGQKIITGAGLILLGILGKDANSSGTAELSR